MRVPEAALDPDREVLMIGTDPDMRGGIASVVSAIRDEGFFEWARVRYVATHVHGGPARKASQFTGAVIAATARLASGRVLLAHAHVSSNGSFWRKALLLWIARCFGVPTIFHLHSGGFDEYATRRPGGALRRRCIRRTLEASDCVIVLSERWAAWVRKFAPKSRIRIVGNPVRVPDHVPHALDPAHALRARNVLYLGLICDAKGSFDLLQAWARFRERVTGWRLVIGGNGEVERFLAEAERLGVGEDVDYLGWVSGDKKEQELARAAVFVLPSYKEGMPVAILEAMAYGAAVIATPVGGVPDMMVADRHGLLVKAGDVVALTEAMVRLAETPDLRSRLTVEARAHVMGHYTSARVVDQLKGIYREMGQKAI